MAKPNFQFKKRQKELAKKKKKEQKRQARLDKKTINSEEQLNSSQDESELV
ncbi:MAG: hypothetical protein R6X10_18505 [Desulfobacterales bacterium]